MGERNRAQRRHSRKSEPDPLQTTEPARAQALRDHERELLGTHRQQDDLSVRAKNSGHGKKTADKWNQ